MLEIPVADQPIILCGDVCLIPSTKLGTIDDLALYTQFCTLEQDVCGADGTLIQRVLSVHYRTWQNIVSCLTKCWLAFSFSEKFIRECTESQQRNLLTLPTSAQVTATLVTPSSSPYPVSRLPSLQCDSDPIHHVVTLPATRSWECCASAPGQPVIHPRVGKVPAANALRSTSQEQAASISS